MIQSEGGGGHSICRCGERYANRVVLRYHFILYIQVNLLDFFCSVVQFYLLLSPYLCFISFLYLFICSRRRFNDKLRVFHAN